MGCFPRWFRAGNWLTANRSSWCFRAEPFVTVARSVQGALPQTGSASSLSPFFYAFSR
jgi:hypothetical protein